MKLKVVKQFKDKNDHKTIYQVGDVINIKEVERVTNLIKRDLCIPVEDEATTAEAQPKTNPAEEQPKTDPAEEQPKTDPAEEQPKTDPAEEQPKTDPAEEKPKTDPAEEKPKRGTRKSGKAESKQEE